MSDTSREISKLLWTTCYNFYSLIPTEDSQFQFVLLILSFKFLMDLRCLTGDLGHLIHITTSTFLSLWITRSRPVSSPTVSPVTPGVGRFSEPVVWRSRRSGKPTLSKSLNTIDSFTWCLPPPQSSLVLVGKTPPAEPCITRYGKSRPKEVKGIKTSDPCIGLEWTKVPFRWLSFFYYYECPCS